ncbi:MAG: FAD-binding protein [Synergistaceae bacterium]|jgi:glycolate oxidase|nr:FAD-binding protein [Synergistaceae bacterium]
MNEANRSEKFGILTPEVLEEIKDAVGAKNVYASRDDIESYSYDMTGQTFAHNFDVLVKPDNAEQISALMKAASRHRIPVTPRAAGSGLAGAAIPIYGGIVLSIEKMNRILEIDSINRVAVVEPGVVTNDLCRAVTAKGLLYAGYPMSTEMSFIAGNIGTNAGGGKVIRYGNTRRHILGMEVVTASGDILKLGGKFRKDTWGYPIMQLLIGTEGTLGIITKITVNLEPLPGKTVNLLAVYLDLDSMVASVAAVVSSGVKIISCEFLDRLSVDVTTKYLSTELPYQDRAEAYLLIQVEGDSDKQLESAYEKVGGICVDNGAMEVFIAESRTDSTAMWQVRQNLAEGMRAADPYTSLSGDVVVPLSEVPKMMKIIAEKCKKWNVVVANLGHIADGNLHPLAMKPEGMTPERWATYSEEFYADVIQEAVKLGGVGSGEHGVGYVKLGALLDSKDKAELDIHRGIKAAFDPLGILNPGKLTPVQ